MSTKDFATCTAAELQTITGGFGSDFPKEPQQLREPAIRFGKPDDPKSTTPYVDTKFPFIHVPR
jgi:hypothetical protein